VFARPDKVGEVSTERPGSVLPRWQGEHQADREPVAIRVVVEPSGAPDGAADPEAEAIAFVRFCYRRRSVAWPELYDEMCAVAAHGDYRGMGYEQLERAGIRFALAALPHLADILARVIAEERSPQVHVTSQQSVVTQSTVAAA
jgi:hypothetical protein